MSDDELDYDQRIRAAIDRRQAKVDEDYTAAVAKAVKAHGGETFWDVPYDERHAIQREFAERSRIAHGKEPKWGDPDPERMKEVREEAGDGKTTLVAPRPDRDPVPGASIECIEAPECNQLAITQRGMRKHIQFRHPDRTQKEVDDFFAAVG